jgi:GT2 family glycosyltransferase
MAGRRLSIVTPVYASSPYLLDITEKLFLESVLRCRERDDFEILLVDDASPLEDELRAVADRSRERGLDVHLIRNPSNRGFAGSIQRGADESRAEFLAVTNNDIFVPDGVVGALLGHLERDERIGAIGPITNDAAAGYRYRAQQQESLEIEDLSERQYARIEAVARARRAASSRLLAVHWLTGFFMVLRRRAYEKAGGVDADYGLGYHEESDLCVRLRKAGYALVVDESSFVFHGDPRRRFVFGPSMASVGGGATASFLRNYLLFVRKNGLREAFSLFYDLLLRRDFPSQPPPIGS